MTKKEVQKRVLQNGKPLPLNKFMWDAKTKTFSSDENYLVLDFNGISRCTFTTGYNCTFKTGHYCTFTTGYNCTFTTWSYCTFTTGYNCTFKTGHYCTFKTGHYCTFTTGYNCTFTTWSYCTFTTESYCVIVRRDVFEVIICDKNKKYQLLPYNIKGYLTAEKDSDIWYNSEGKEAVVIDGIYSVVTERKGNVLKVINHEETEESYIVTDGINYSHGKTIQQAKESLIYKISDRDTSEYNSLTLNSVVSLEDGVKMYRKITGSCEEMTKAFVERLEKKKEYKISEIISLTKGQYNNEIFTKFFAK